MEEIEERTVPRRAEGIHEHRLGDELLLYSAGIPDGLGLNSSAAAIWELCDGRRSVGEIARRLALEVGCTKETLLDDVCGAVRRLGRAQVLLWEELGERPAG